MTFHPTSTRGVTLAELMIALTIVSALALLLFGGVQSVRERSQAARCGQHLRQVASAALQWVGENNGNLPDRSYWSVILRSSGTDRWSIYPYLGLPYGHSDRASALTCPTHHARFQPENPANSSIGSWGRTYGINMYMVGSIGGDASAAVSDLDYSWRRLARVPQPSRTAFFLDGPVTPLASGTAAYNQRFQYPDVKPLTASQIGVKGSLYLHSGTLQVVFLDGHVEALSHERIVREGITDKNHPLWGRKP